MKKTFLLLMALGLSTLIVSCSKDDEGSGPSNQITYNGDSDNVVASTVLQAGASFGVQDLFPSDSTEKKHLIAAISVTSAKYGVIFQVGSSDTSQIATGVYNVTFLDESDASVTSGNVVILGSFIETASAGENIEDFIVTEGTVTVNSIDDENISVSFDFVMANEEAVSGGYSGKYFGDNGL